MRRIVTKIMAAHHNKAKPHKGISGGDPFVIAWPRTAARTGPSSPTSIRAAPRTAKSLSCATPKA